MVESFVFISKHSFQIHDAMPLMLFSNAQASIRTTSSPSYHNAVSIWNLINGKGFDHVPMVNQPSASPFRRQLVKLPKEGLHLQIIDDDGLERSYRPADWRTCRKKEWEQKPGCKICWSITSYTILHLTLALPWSSYLVYQPNAQPTQCKCSLTPRNDHAIPNTQTSSSNHLNHHFLPRHISPF